MHNDTIESLDQFRIHEILTAHKMLTFLLFFTSFRTCLFKTMWKLTDDGHHLPTNNVEKSGCLRDRVATAGGSI